MSTILAVGVSQEVRRASRGAMWRCLAGPAWVVDSRIRGVEAGR